MSNNMPRFGGFHSDNEPEPDKIECGTSTLFRLEAVAYVMAATAVYWVIGVAWRAIELAPPPIWLWPIETILLAAAALVLWIVLMARMLKWAFSTLK